MSSAAPSSTPQQDPFGDIASERGKEWDTLIATYGHPTSEYNFQVTDPGHGFNFSCGPVQLVVSTALTYPAFAPSYQVTLCGKHAAVDPKILDAKLERVAKEKRGEVFLADLIDEVRKYVQALPPAGRFILDTAVRGTQLEQQSPMTVQSPDVERDEYAWLESQLMSRLKDLDAETTQNLREKITVDAISKALPHPVKLSYAEVVLSEYLLQPFVEAHQAMIDKYAEEGIKVRPKETRESVAERVAKIDIVYYSANHPYSTYLTQVGFSAEGGSSSHQLADGIYTARQVASLFGKSKKRPAQLFHGQQVIVCAAICGVQYQMEIDYACCVCCRILDDTVTGLGPEFGDSAITPDREWAIFFDPDHLLPLYILHLETVDGEENPRVRWEDLPEEEKKEFLTAHAKKHFPFGFGKAGSKFVVEDKAQSRDDEE